MSNVFSEVSESKIWKNEKALLAEYLPETLPHREGQIKMLVENLMPASKFKKPQNTFVYGPPGIGKTACILFVFREFEEYSERVKTIYINTWDYKTSTAILSKIIIDLDFFVPRRGLSKDEIKEKLIEAIKKTDKSLILCLDEVDQLIYKDPNVLYDLSRFDQYIDVPIGLILISNNPYILKDIDPRIKSTLSLQELEFKPYTLNEMRDILEERVKIAFHAASVEKGVILLAADHTMKRGGDVRVGLECLRRAAMKAEEELCDKIKVEHMKKVIHDVTCAKPKIIRKKLNKIEKTFLEILEEKGEMSSTQLFEEYNSRSSRQFSKRYLRKHLNHLEQTGLIETKLASGVKGKKRIVRKIR